MYYRIERSGTTATLYLAGTVSADDALTLCAACSALPLSVGTLRLDFRAIGSMSAAAIAVVRTLLRHWRAHRGGELRLSTTHLVATFSAAERPVVSHERPARMSIGTYCSVGRAGTMHRTLDGQGAPCCR